MAIWKNIILIFIAFLVSGCADFSLKRSANNRLIDSKGFHGGKRRPLYNKKYINQAKRNVKDGNYDDDYYDNKDNDEELAPSERNRSIYKSMIERERRKAAAEGSYGSRNDAMEYDEDYPRLSDAKKRSASPDGKSEQEMRRELQEIKKMLSNTQKDMAKYRCPLSEQQNKNVAPEPNKEIKPTAPLQRTHSISSPEDD
ncbi:MAG: hypothetical protein KA998_00735 [Rickettsiaceae bacterium]|nr:hypothetical protein [Rickettsiaceae bacterium]